MLLSSLDHGLLAEQEQRDRQGADRRQPGNPESVLEREEVADLPRTRVCPAVQWIFVDVEVLGTGLLIARHGVDAQLQRRQG